MGGILLLEEKPCWCLQVKLCHKPIPCGSDSHQDGNVEVLACLLYYVFKAKVCQKTHFCDKYQQLSGRSFWFGFRLFGGDLSVGGWSVYVGGGGGGGNWEGWWWWLCFCVVSSDRHGMWRCTEPHHILIILHIFCIHLWWWAFLSHCSLRRFQ